MAHEHVLSRLVLTIGFPNKINNKEKKYGKQYELRHKKTYLYAVVAPMETTVGLVWRLSDYA